MERLPTVDSLFHGVKYIEVIEVYKYQTIFEDCLTRITDCEIEGCWTLGMIPRWL